MKVKVPPRGQGGKDHKGGKGMPQDHQLDPVSLGKGSGKKGHLEGGEDGKVAKVWLYYISKQS